MKLLEDLIDLYNLHDDPKSLYGYDRAYNEVPELAWKKYACDKDGHIKSRFTAAQKAELKKRENLWAQDPEFAYNYAVKVIKGRWPPGEDAIVKDPQWAYWYAFDVIKGRFPAGEDAIAKRPEFAYWYAFSVIKGRWPPGEDVIAKYKDYKEVYALYVMHDKSFWKKKAKGKIK